MFPFVPEELGNEFDLKKNLCFGSLPIIWASKTPKETLRAYVEMFLKEEIQAEALVKNLPGFARFLPVAAIFHGQVLNIANIARDAGVARTTVSGYIEILEDTLMAYRLPAFEGKLRVREKKHSKFYWIDCGVVRAIKKQLGPVTNEEKGTLFEGWVGMLLRLYGEYYELFDNLYYWSPAESKKTEVDFLLQKGKDFIAIEIKSSSKIHNSDMSGLKAVSELNGLKRRVLVYLGDKKLKTIDNIEVLPLNDFLKILSKNTIWH